MTEFESLVVEKLSEIEKQAAGTHATLSALNTRLFDGPASVITTIQADIQEIKDARESDARWDRFHNIAHYSLPPLLTIGHALLRRFGVNV